MRGGGSGVGMMRQAVANRLGDGDEEELGKPYDHKVILRLLTYLQPYRTKAVFALLAMIAYTTTAASVPFFVRAGINRITEKDSSGLDTVVFIFAGVALAGWLAQYIQMMLMAQINTGILYTLRVQMFRHLQRLSLSFYDKNEVGRIMSRVQNDILNLQEFLTGGVQSIAELFVLVFVVGSMFYMEPTLAAFTLTVVPVLLIALAIWQKYARSAFIRVRQAIALVNADLQENISGVRVIQSLSREEENAKRFDSVNRGNLNKNVKASRLSAMIMPMVEILMATAITSVVIYGGNRVLDGSIEVAIV
ncbi:MAG: ABC transporter ATP-binding protein, partial [Chloroflexi bacterium]|nr:ABC transporter ATP-binding protein [Chloroflexota bacterium]